MSAPAAAPSPRLPSRLIQASLNTAGTRTRSTDSPHQTATGSMQSLKSDGADWNEKYGETMTDDFVNKIAERECNNRDRRDGEAGTDRHSTIVICEACTSKGLNSPDLPYLSVAVTLNRTIPVAVSCGTTHLATQNSRSGCFSVAR